MPVGGEERFSTFRWTCTVIALTMKMTDQHEEHVVSGVMLMSAKYRLVAVVDGLHGTLHRHGGFDSRAAARVARRYFGAFIRFGVGLGFGQRVHSTRRAGHR